MQNVGIKIPKEVKTKLDNMNLIDRFLFNEAVEDAEVYRDMVEILLEGKVPLYL